MTRQHISATPDILYETLQQVMRSGDALVNQTDGHGGRVVLESLSSFIHLPAGIWSRWLDSIRVLHCTCDSGRSSKITDASRRYAVRDNWMSHAMTSWLHAIFVPPRADGDEDEKKIGIAVTE